MRPTRHQPHVGDEAEIVHLGAREPAVVTAVDGRSVTVVTEGGEQQVFDLNRLTGHFVRRGESYWGTRLKLGPAADDDASWRR